MHVALRRAWGMRQGATQRRRLTGAQAGGVLRAPRGHGRRSCLKIVGLDGLGSCENKGPFTKTRPALYTAFKHVFVVATLTSRPQRPLY